MISRRPARRAEELTAFLEARLAEEETAWNAPDSASLVMTIPPRGVHPVAPRMLRQVTAVRRILAEVVPEIEGMDEQIIGEWGTPGTPADAHLPLLEILATIWSDHPDFPEGGTPEWGLT